MSEKTHRRKLLFFLIGLSAFAYFAAQKSKQVNFEKISVGEYVIAEEVKEEKTDSVETTSDEQNLEENMFFEVDEELNPVKRVYPDVVLSEEEILGSTNCRTPWYSYDTDKICYDDSSTFDYSHEKENRSLDVGEVIPLDATIRLTSIEVPPLMNGSITMDSSVRQIFSKEDSSDGKDHWTQRPDGEMVNREIVEGNAYPGDPQTKEILDQADESQKKPFGLTYYFEGQSNAETEGSDEVIIEKYMRNDCGEYCRNAENPTPEKFVNTSGILTQSKNYPTFYEKEEGEEEKEEIEMCPPDTTFVDMNLDKVRKLGCLSFVDKIAITLRKIIATFSDTQACSTEGGGVDPVLGTPCNEDENYYYYLDEKGLCSIMRPREDCVNTASIIVIMESPWGKTGECGLDESEPCVTEYNELRSGNFRAPGQKASGSVYVLTDCKAYIREITKTVPLKCAWDIDHIAKELEFQSVDNLPGEDYPDKMEYINFQVEMGEIRTDEPIPM